MIEAEGIIGRKLGMTQIFGENGRLEAVTAVSAGPCFVNQIKTQEKDGYRFMLEGGFDGFYTYFATDGFTVGSTVGNWPKLADWARAHHKLFVPCVAPGYVDTRIRQWNGARTRDREAGAYYDRMWSAALKVSPELLGITSFNEWHEGTQIETAVPKQIPGFSYLNYQQLASDNYLDRTAQWIRRMNSK